MSNQLTSYPFVAILNNKVITTSLDVARCFVKRHDNVLRAISNLECSSEFAALNFELSSYTDCTGRNLSVYNMTKDGFVFLAMGFTGKRAAQFKEAYIEAFNEMEKRLSLSCDEDSVIVNLQALRNLINNVLWIDNHFKVFNLLNAINMLGGHELAYKLGGRFNDIHLALHFLKANKSLSLPCNP